MNNKQQGNLNLEVVFFIAILVLFSVLFSDYSTKIHSAKIRAAILDISNLANKGKQIIIKKSPFDTDYITTNKYVETTIPVKNLTSKIVQTNNIGNNTKLRAYWRTANNSVQQFFYKKRLYNE